MTKAKTLKDYLMKDEATGKYFKIPNIIKYEIKGKNSKLINKLPGRVYCVADKKTEVNYQDKHATISALIYPGGYSFYLSVELCLHDKEATQKEVNRAMRESELVSKTK